MIVTTVPGLEGIWGTGRGQGGHGSDYVPAGCMEDADNGYCSLYSCGALSKH